MPSILARLEGIALDLLFPRWCVGCGKEGALVCPSCLGSAPRLTPPLCPRCGLPQPGSMLCPGCTGSEQSELDGIRSPFRFEGVIREAVHQLKYRNLRALAEPMAHQLSYYLTENPLPVEVLVPVPLHPRRLKERGYNQSRLLAERLHRATGLPLVEDCLVRERPTPPQARTTALSERKTNVRGAFRCRDERLKDRRVLLIDDVATSGATLGACATALKAGRASSVWGLVLAREI
ncbi:MAG: ComF family protein [Chloroflexota bacterium]